MSEKKFQQHQASIAIPPPSTARRVRGAVLFGSLALAVTAFVNQSAAAPDAGPYDDAGLDGGDAQADGGKRRKTDEELVRMGQGLLDNGDLTQMGSNLLDPEPATQRAAKRDGGGSSGGANGANGPDGPNGATGANGAAGANGANGPNGASGGSDGPNGASGPNGTGGPSGAIGEDGGPTASGAESAALDLDAGFEDDSGLDASSPEAIARAAQRAEAERALAKRGGAGGGGKRSTASETQLEMRGLEDSPFAKLGVPVQAVPAVATAATAGLMAAWPALLKTLTGLLKSLFAAKLKNRAKQGKKIDEEAKAVTILGMSFRPVELGSIFIAAFIYGLGVCYTFQGRNMQRGFVLGQEMLVLAIYYFRGIVRFFYQRIYNLKTQYKFWLGGGFLCLASAYLGNTLGTVGYELESASAPDDAKRIVRMKAFLVWLAIILALAFFAANRMYPHKLLQSGRVMMSGMALAEILPIAPMPGQKIYADNKRIWAVLAMLIIPTFFVINFMFK